MLVDCDTGAVESRIAQVLQFPVKEDRWLLLGLKSISGGRSFNTSQIHLSDDNREPLPTRNEDDSAARDLLPDFNGVATSLEQCPMDLQVQLLFFDVMFNLLRYVPDCLFYLNPSCPVFNRALFISEYSTEEYKGILEQLTVTNSFHELTENIHTPSVKFFLDCIDRVNNNETVKIDIDLPSPGGAERGYSESKGSLAQSDSAKDNDLNSNLKSAMRSSTRMISTPRSGGILSTPRNGLLSTPRNAVGKKLNRPISMANIIYDKIVINTPRHARTPRAYQNNKMTEEVATKRKLAVDFQLEMKPDLPPCSTPERASTPESSNDTLDKSTKSRLLRSGPSADDLTAYKYASQPEEVLTKRRNAWDSTLPEWLLASAAFSQSKSIVSFLLCRINIYLPYVKWLRFFDSKRELPSVSNLVIQVRQYGHRKAESALTPTYDLVPLCEAASGNKEPSKSSKLPESEKVFHGLGMMTGIIKIDTNFNSDNDEKLRCQLQEELSTANNRFEDLLSLPCPSFPVSFNIENLLLVQQQIFRWTLFDLADHFKKSNHFMLRRFKAIQPAGENANGGVNNKYRPNAGKSYQKNIMQHAANSTTSLTMTDEFKCDSVVTELLQKIFTEGSFQNEWLSKSIQCSLLSLQSEENRKGMINILKNAKKRKGVNDNKKHSEGSNFSVYPLNQLAFEAVSTLFNGLLQICVNQQDYLCAYGLLEVGGLYFRVVESSELSQYADPEADASSINEEEELKSIEFLSERTCHHPIYQNPLLWRALMHKRLPINVANVGKFNMLEIVNETQALLYVMLGMNVNSPRALQFLQAIAADYNLNINEYFKLQRFTGKLWAQNNTDFIETKKKEGEIFGSKEIADNSAQKIPQRTGSVFKNVLPPITENPSASTKKDLYYSLDELDGLPMKTTENANLTPSRQDDRNLPPRPPSPLKNSTSEAAPAPSSPAPRLTPPENVVDNKGPFPFLRINTNTNFSPIEDRPPEDATNDRFSPRSPSPEAVASPPRPFLPKLSVDIEAANRTSKILQSFISPELHSPELSVPNGSDLGSIDKKSNQSNDSPIDELRIDLLVQSQQPRSLIPPRLVIPTDSPVAKEVVSPSPSSSRVSENNDTFTSVVPPKQPLPAIYEGTGSWSRSAAFDAVSSLIPKLSRNSASNKLTSSQQLSMSSIGVSDCSKVGNRYSMVDIKVVSNHNESLIFLMRLTI